MDINELGKYKTDLIIHDLIILELKAVDFLIVEKICVNLFNLCHLRAIKTCKIRFNFFIAIQKFFQSNF